MEAKATKPDLVFFGDSITEGWNEHPTIWASAFGLYKPLNFGMGGDRTQHILWRIENGELDGIEPKVVVIMIGTNNITSDTASGIASGIARIVELIRAKSPATKVLLLGIFPRGKKPDPYRERVKEVNLTIKKLDDNKNVFFLDLGGKFLQSDGTMTKEIMPDFLHPSAKGYQIWAEGMAPLLETLVR